MNLPQMVLQSVQHTALSTKYQLEAAPFKKQYYYPQY